MGIELNFYIAFSIAFVLLILSTRLAVALFQSS